MKRTITALMAVVMVISCATLVSDASSDVDAQMVVDMEVGDAWGMGGTVDLQTLVDAMGAGNGTPQGGDAQMTVEDLYTMIEAIAMMAETDLSIEDLDLSAEIWSLYEVVGKSTTGYIIDMESVLNLRFGASLTASGEMDDLLDEILDDAPDRHVTVILDNLVSNVFLNIDGTFHVDRSFGVEAAEMGIGLGAVVTGSSNIVATDRGIDFTETATAMDDIIIDLEMDLSMTAVDKPLYLLPPGEYREWEGAPKYHMVATGSMYSSFVNATDNGVIAVETNVKVPYEGESFVGTDGVMRVSIDIEDAEEIAFKYPFETNTVPAFLLVGDNLKLDQSEVSIVKNAISVSKNPVKESLDDVSLKVTLYDTERNVWKTYDAQYGTTVDLPDYTDVREGFSFVGWGIKGVGTVWDENTPITGHVELYPVISKVKDSMPTRDDFNSTGSVLWNIVEGSENLDKAIPESVLENGTLYVNVTDSKGNVLYAWEIFAGVDDDLTGSQVMVGITEGDLPDADYVKDCVGDDAAMYLQFSASGDMPTTTHVSYNVGDFFADGSTVELYYDNTAESTAVYQMSLTVEDNTVNIPLSHCSSYILVGEGGNSGDGGFDVMTIVVIAVVILAILAVGFIIVKNRNGTI